MCLLFFKAAFRGFMVVLAISLHAIFEGIAMGTLGKASVIWYLCFAIAAHKFIIAFCVGMQVCMEKYLFTFVASYPCGTPRNSKLLSIYSWHLLA